MIKPWPLCTPVRHGWSESVSGNSALILNAGRDRPADKAPASQSVSRPACVGKPAHRRTGVPGRKPGSTRKTSNAPGAGFLPAGAYRLAFGPIHLPPTDNRGPENREYRFGTIGAIRTMSPVVAGAAATGWFDPENLPQAAHRRHQCHLPWFFLLWSGCSVTSAHP